MTHHAFRTAVTLYAGGTLDLDAAASHAGVSRGRLARRAASTTVLVPEVAPEDERERLQVAGD